MMYMTGGGLQIFSVMSVWFLLKQAVSGIFAVEKGEPLPFQLPHLGSPFLLKLTLVSLSVRTICHCTIADKHHATKRTAAAEGRVRRLPGRAALRGNLEVQLDGPLANTRQRLARIQRA